MSVWTFSFVDPVKPIKTQNRCQCGFAIRPAMRYSVSRQKACKQCAAAKARCDRRAGRCGRCARRELSCAYAGSSFRGADGDVRNSEHLPGGSFHPTNSDIIGRRGPSPAGSFRAVAYQSPAQPSQGTSPNGAAGPGRPSCPGPRVPESLDFSDLDLFCPINPEDISNRWLQTFVPIPGQKTKEYPAAITAFISRVLGSYATMTVRGRGVPPFVHSSQTTAAAARLPLSVCLNLLRRCEIPPPGGEDAARDILGKEMTGLYEQHGTFDDLTLLSAFQSYLIYSLVLFFRGSPGGNPFLRQAMMNLQELACATSRQGLVCGAEDRRARPGWEAWIVAEAKRRTLFAMYLFDSVLLAGDGLPTFLGTELRGLLAPGNKALWGADRRDGWEAAYDVHLEDWGEGGLNIEELWPMEPGLGEGAGAERRDRVGRWLEGVDEFGMMIYAVTSCTHGG